MSQDDEMRLRVEGKTNAQARTVWQLDVGGQRWRCIRRRKDGTFELQHRTDRVWRTWRTCADAGRLLMRLLDAKQLPTIMSAAEAAAKGAP